jgi:hypothetical protein
VVRASPRGPFLVCALCSRDNQAVTTPRRPLSHQVPTRLQLMPRSSAQYLLTLWRRSTHSRANFRPSQHPFLPSRVVVQAPNLSNYSTAKQHQTQQPVWPYLYSSKKIMAPQLDSFFKQVDSLSEAFIERLRQAVAIPSVSADDERRPDVVKVSPSPKTMSLQCSSY